MVCVLTHAQLTRRRTFGALSLLLGVVLIVVAVLSMLGKLGSSSPSASSGDGSVPSPVSTSGSAAATTSAAPTTPALDPNAKAPVTVVNASGTAGLAGRVRDVIVKGGWQVADIGNYTGEVGQTSSIYYPADDQNAVAAATNLQKQFPKLTQLTPTPAGFPFTGVVVVLAGDWDPAPG